MVRKVFEFYPNFGEQGFWFARFSSRTRKMRLRSSLYKIIENLLDVKVALLQLNISGLDKDIESVRMFKQSNSSFLSNLVSFTYCCHTYH